jgi:uncharacterized sulfatase
VRRAAFLAVAVAAGLGVRPAPVPAQHALRPHIVLLAVDGVLATDEALPSVRALARRGRPFLHAYLPHPLADQARLALLSGRRPDRVAWEQGGERPPDVVLLPEHLRQAGYFVARVGRGLGAGRDAAVAWETAVEPSPTDAEATVAAVEALLDEKRDRPAFIAAGFDELGPVPGVSARSDAPPDGPERPAVALDDLDAVARPGQTARARAAGAGQRQEAAVAHDVRAKRLDAQLARLTRFLEQRGLWRDTVVVLVGTQACGTGRQGAFVRPDVLFEETLQVPLVVAAPGLEGPGLGASAPVDVTGLFATLAELAGVPAAAADVPSLVPLLREAGRGSRGALSMASRQPPLIARSVRTARWRYSEWPDGSRELYDHDADPGEHTNLASLPAHAATAAELSALLAPPPAPAAPAPVPAAKGRRPNVLLIVLDDLNVHLGTYGYPVKTPSIDRLAARGRRFDRAYAQSPMCSPSRASFLSGWSPLRTRVWDNTQPPRREGMVPIQEHFQANGYFTASVGKVWETSFATDFKWDLAEHAPAGAAEADAEGGAPRPRRGKNEWWIPTDNADADEPDGLRARRAVEILEAQRDRPLFLAVGIAKPHLRWVAPRRYFDMYDPAAITFTAAPADDLADVPALAVKNQRLERPGLMLAGREPAGLNPADDFRRQATAAYYAAVSFADAQVGVILDAMDRLGRWDDTVVVLLGDHGFHLGEHRGLWRKDTLFEEVARAPLIVAAPGMGQPGVATSSLAELLDVYPTLVELAGIPAPPGLDGRSQAAVLRDPRAVARTAALSYRAVNPPTLALSVRGPRHRYTLWPDGSEELFDLEADPAQRANLAGQPAHAAALADMRARRAEMDR